MQDDALLLKMNSWVLHEIESSGNDGFRELVERGGGSIFRNAPTVIIVSSDPKNRNGLVNAAAATENMLIVAESLGISSCWIGMVSMLSASSKVDDYAKELQLPAGYAPHTGITLGYRDSLTPTRSFPSFLLGGSKYRRKIINFLLWRITEQFVWQVARKFDAKVRRELLNIAPLPFFGPAKQDEKQQVPLLYAYSPLVLPRPTDWPERIHVTGYWFADPPKEWTPPPMLVDFLENGERPVYVGFGSMTGGDPEETLKMMIRRALDRSRQRGILLSGWAGLGEGRTLPDNAFIVKSVPHSWLFPRVAAVVHHGGAGTTGAGLRAGVPSVLIPFVADRPSWARRIEQLGVGPHPIPFRESTAERLANAS